MKAILKTFADELENEEEFLALLPTEIFPRVNEVHWRGANQARSVLFEQEKFHFDTEKRYFHVYYKRADFYEEWANFILVFAGNDFKGSFCLGVQGVLEQSGAYRQAERLLVTNAIIPLLWSEFPRFKGEISLAQSEYFLDAHQLWLDQPYFEKNTAVSTDENEK